MFHTLVGSTSWTGRLLTPFPPIHFIFYFRQGLMYPELVTDSLCTKNSLELLNLSFVSSFLCLPRAGITNVDYPTRFLRCWGSKAGLSTHHASSLWTKLHTPRPPLRDPSLRKHSALQTPWSERICNTGPLTTFNITAKMLSQLRTYREPWLVSVRSCVPKGITQSSTGDRGEAGAWR